MEDMTGVILMMYILGMWLLYKNCKGFRRFADWFNRLGEEEEDRPAGDAAGAKVRR